MKNMVDRKKTNHLTYKLKFIAESLNDGLKEDNLKLHGFNGGRSIQTPMHNNPELFEYISLFSKIKVFLTMTRFPILKRFLKERKRKL